MPVPIPNIQSDANKMALLDAFVHLGLAHAGSGQEPGLIICMPPVWGNKYQLMLYGEAANHGFAVMGARSLADLDNISWPGPVILHAHWFSHLFAGASTDSEAESLLEKIKDAVTQFKHRTGAKLLWTAHNIFPHGNTFPRTYLKLRRWIMKEFDAVHVMDSEHLPRIRSAFDAEPRLCVCLSHMTYEGYVEDVVDRRTARMHFGIPMDAFCVGLFGSLQSYKGLEGLMAAYREAAATSERPMFLLVAGSPADRALVSDLRDHSRSRNDIRIVARHIPDYEVQYVHRALDLTVLSYAESLNSGAAWMAATFGIPFLVPDRPGNGHLFRIGGIPYPAENGNGLVSALREYAAGKKATAASDLSKCHPKDISAAFFAFARWLAQTGDSPCLADAPCKVVTDKGNRPPFLYLQELN